MRLANIDIGPNGTKVFNFPILSYGRSGLPFFAKKKLVDLPAMH